ncbi:MAG: four helix bundle protein [Firmicutes bacterium]|jgi:four helix bundle protein|nr:four helix bundle protein [Bacillota bacterium]
MLKYHKLEIYHLAKKLVSDCYNITNFFPETERFGLSSQMNRAAISVASNIVEGSTRNSDRDTKYFINISYSSLMELICQTEIAYDLKFISNNDFEIFSEEAIKLSIKITNFAKSLNN